MALRLWNMHQHCSFRRWASICQDKHISTKVTIPKTASRLKAAAMLTQLGMMVHLRPSLSAANDAGKTTIRFNIAIAENVAPMTSNK